MQLRAVKNYEEMSILASSMLVEKVNKLERPVLGLATGSTPEGLYKQLIKQYEEKKVSFQHVKTFNLDEYVGLNKQDEQSYHYYMKDKLFRHVDIPEQHVHLPNGAATNLDEECKAYESRIKENGGIDVQILGIGLNGHIGFNEPGTSFSSRTHLVDLAPSTRQA
ncbi:glucosamine-6-phosphate deaminase, partial [Streptomyces rhizosphaericus]